MIIKQVTTPTSALPARPERPFKYVWPVISPDGTVGYDRPLENYFDTSMASRLLPSKPPTKLYDTVARAHDRRYQVPPDAVDPSWSTPRPLILNPPERRRSLANLTGNSPEYMGISPDVPGWHPRRTAYEDRRGAVGVTPSEVNTLVPYIPPIDTSSPPPSREWLDAMAKRFLADAHADFEESHRNTTTDVAPPTESSESLESDDAFFNYDTDSTVDCVAVSRSSMPQSSRQAESETHSHDADLGSTTDTNSDTDTDTDTDSDEGYDWSVPRSPPSGPGAQWLIPRKRPSVVIVNNKDVTMVDNSSDVSMIPPPHSFSDDHPGKRQRGENTGRPKRVTKTPKRHMDDTPARRGRKANTASGSTKEAQGNSSERVLSLPRARPLPPVSDEAAASSITATALQMRQVRLASPDIASPWPLPQQHTDSSVPPRSPKLFPCMLDGCAQVCASAGDLQRHQQSLRHRAPSHGCLACGKSYTRSDALKRHFNSKASCKRDHAAKLTSGPEVQEGGAEASDEAVQIMASSFG